MLTTLKDRCSGSGGICIWYTRPVLCFGKLMCKLTGGKVNPLIGSAGVSAVPMAARVSQKVGAEADPTNFLLMHAMGPERSRCYRYCSSSRYIHGNFRSLKFNHLLQK